MSKRVDVVGSAQLGFHLHDELSLTLKFLAVEHLFLFEGAASFIGLLRLLDFVHARPNDLVLQQDTLLQLFCRLRQSVLGRPVMPLVVSALLVKFELECPRDIALKRKDIEI